MPPTPKSVITYIIFSAESGVTKEEWEGPDSSRDYFLATFLAEEEESASSPGSASSPSGRISCVRKGILSS